MTPDEIATMSRAVAQHFRLWTPGQMCNYGDVQCRHFDEPLADTWDELTQGKFKPHEMPCPDLTQPEHFVRLLKVLYPRVGLVFAKAGRRELRAHCEIWTPTITRIERDADTPEEALLLAAYQLVQREAAK